MYKVDLCGISTGRGEIFSHGWASMEAMNEPFKDFLQLKPLEQAYGCPTTQSSVHGLKQKVMEMFCGWKELVCRIPLLISGTKQNPAGTGKSILW